MLEKDLIKAVNKKLPKPFHSQSMTGASMHTNGTPDRYYDPENGRYDLWAEYKMLDAMPRSGLVGFVHATKKGCYSPLQFAWMERRYKNSLAHGRPNTVGIVGLPNRTVVLQTTPTEWREGSPVGMAIDLEELAAWITEFCFQSSVLRAAC